MADVAPFADFYRAANSERDPLPWQARLADLVVTRGWPAQIGVPTGLGKTGCLDIAVWALGRTAGSNERRAPTRIWYVVNRRLLVDAAWEHACHLAGLLASPGSLSGSAREAVASVADALRSMVAIGVENTPLFVTRLRGGGELGARSPDPSQPSLLLATVPMFASRWLFRGYGSSTSMRPIDAAHAGIDSLVLLDEAHLSRPLLQLNDRLAACDIGDPVRVVSVGRSRPVLVALTATGEAVGQRFDLDDDDRDHPAVAARLHAPKRAELVKTSTKELAGELATTAAAKVDGGTASCIVFANTPTTARSVAEAIVAGSRRSGRDTETLLVTGRVRAREGDRLRDRLLDPATGARAGIEVNRERPLVVVATQTLEVGADVDFDHLVTETAGVRSLIQRLGRVNRLGSRREATCTICHPVDRTSWPIYGEEPAKVWSTLQAAKEAGSLDLSPGGVAETLGTPQDIPMRAGELLPVHLWEWAKTTVPPQGEAPIELFIDGFDAGGEVSIVWRAHRPAPGVRLAPSVRASEAVDVPLHELRDALGDQEVERLAADRVSLEKVASGGLRPGDVVVLAPVDGLYDQYGWNPTAREAVLDVSPLQSGTLLLETSVLENLAPGCLDDPGLRAALRMLEEPPEEGVDEAVTVGEVIASMRACAPHPWLGDNEWQGFLGRLGTAVARPVDDVPAVMPAPLSHRWQTVAIRSDAFEELSFSAASHKLGDHLEAVGDAAARIADRLGLADPLVEVLRLAGRLHDLGKADPRFQRWLDPDAVAEAPLAKSRLAPEQLESARVAAGWPRGARHELLSVRLIAAWLDEQHLDRDKALLLHLIASHHGFGRPLMRSVDDPFPVVFAAAIDGAAVAGSGDLSVPDWEQPERFREVCQEYGYWGTALLEAILRQADHLVSQVTAVA